MNTPKSKTLEEIESLVQRLTPENRLMVLKRAKKLLRWQKKTAQKKPAK